MEREIARDLNAGSMLTGSVVNLGAEVSVEAELRAVDGEVLASADVDVAMKLGVNYPEGPLEWGHRIGYSQIGDALRNLQSSYGEERYRCSPWLTQKQYN